MQRHGAWLAVRTGYRKLSDVSVDRHSTDAPARCLAQPERSIPHNDGERPTAGVMPFPSSVMQPSGVTQPIRWTSAAENQMFPSGPSAMPSGPAAAVGSANTMIAPLRLRRPMRLPVFSVNQRLPSAPTSMPIGVLSADGKSNSRNVQEKVSKQPIFEAPLSQNQRFPSGPSTAM